MRTKALLPAIALLFLCNLLPTARADDTSQLTEQTSGASTSEAEVSAPLEPRSLFLLGGGLILVGWALKRLRHEFLPHIDVQGDPKHQHS